MDPPVDGFAKKSRHDLASRRQGQQAQLGARCPWRGVQPKWMITAAKLAKNDRVNRMLKALWLKVCSIEAP